MLWVGNTLVTIQFSPRLAPFEAGRIQFVGYPIHPRRGDIMTDSISSIDRNGGIVTNSFPNQESHAAH
jgi:hypothetical protein